MFNRRLFALLIKESTELLRNRQLVLFLTISPIISMIIFGYVLNSSVTHLKLGILDQNQVAISRELVDAFTTNQVFQVDNYTYNQSALTHQVERGSIDAGLLISPTFSRDLLQTGTAEIGVELDGINAYSAGLAQGYVTQIITQFNLHLLEKNQPLSAALNVPIQSKITFRYNPGTLDK